MMTQYKIDGLSGWRLDFAVALAEGKTNAQSIVGVEHVDDHVRLMGGSIGGEAYRPSTDWTIGGPIIQRERILLEPSNKVDPYPEDWLANIGPERYDGHYRRTTSYRYTALGGTALIAAMRCYVRSRFGDTVELHD